MKRRLYDESHEAFRETFRRFIEDEILGHYEEWQKQGQVPREIYQRAGAQGFLCPTAAEKWGGAEADFRFAAIVAEELYFHSVPGVFFPLHSDIVFPYLEKFCNQAQLAKWAPGCVRGEHILAIAMTEPDAGSDLAALRTKAELKNNQYILNGTKTFISNGQIADLFVVAARTSFDPAKPHRGISLFVIESDRPGFRRGRNLPKIGFHAQDTSELAFEDCVIPKENLLGAEGEGWRYLMENLQQERLVLAIGAAAAADSCVQMTRDYVKERQVFGQPLANQQHTRFTLAECATQVQLAYSFLDDLIPRHLAGEKLMGEVSMAKYWISDTQSSVADRCLQLFGGYGYMTEYPISRQYVDARVQRIYGGANEIMKELIARELLGKD
ncbi:MAG: acyl-CoA dehydrogenase family protein [Bdellovibrionales bacterium]|nr:acyl-CoA dehydrogenase family protein [Bdellovibrionales bacterium]